MRALWISGIVACIGSVAVAQMIDRFLTARLPVIGAFAGFELSHNPGIAFGFELHPEWQFWIILGALILVGVAAVRTAHTRLSQIGFGLILGGGLANIIDRIPDGLVTDFIQVGTFPTFNVADSCITVGVALLLIEMLIQRFSGK